MIPNEFGDLRVHRFPFLHTADLELLVKGLFDCYLPEPFVWRNSCFAVRHTPISNIVRTGLSSGFVHVCTIERDQGGLVWVQKSKGVHAPTRPPKRVARHLAKAS